MKTITLYNGKLALVDDEDFDRLQCNRYRLRGNGEGAVGRDFREKITIPTNPPITLSKLRYSSLANDVMQTHGLLYDHKDRNPLNNQKSNLRLCSVSQNNFNRNKTKFCNSKYKGIYWRKDLKRWIVRFMLNGKYIYGGVFKEETKAAEIYNKLATEFHGEFAALNIIK
jgi:hypothetical protein